MSEFNWFKAQTALDRSRDILIPFSSKWNGPLRTGSVSHIFRRRYPKAFCPKRAFVYVASPFSEILGMFQIAHLKPVTLSEALQLAQSAAISEAELRVYFTGYQSIGCYSVGDISLFRNPVTLATLRGVCRFYPPQGFISLSQKASEWLDNASLHDQ
jgi:predicted transcriptional regulator